MRNLYKRYNKVSIKCAWERWGGGNGHYSHADTYILKENNSWPSKITYQPQKKEKRIIYTTGAPKPRKKKKKGKKKTFHLNFDLLISPSPDSVLGTTEIEVAGKVISIAGFIPGDEDNNLVSNPKRCTVYYLWIAPETMMD